MRRVSRRKLRRKNLITDIPLTPLIDTALTLLIIFMITAPLLTQGINVNLPQTSSKALPPNQQQPLIVSVNQAGQYFLNLSAHPTQAISPQQLMSQTAAYLQIAKQQHKQRGVYVKGDSHVNYGKVVQAMVLLQRAGAQDVGLITQPLPTKTGA